MSQHCYYVNTVHEEMTSALKGGGKNDRQHTIAMATNRRSLSICDRREAGVGVVIRFEDHNEVALADAICAFMNENS